MITLNEGIGNQEFTRLCAKIRKATQDSQTEQLLARLEEIAYENAKRVWEYSCLGEKLNTRDTDVLLDHVLSTSRKLVNCDGGTVYLLEREHIGSIIDQNYEIRERLFFRVLQNESLNTFLGGSSKKEIKFEPVELKINGKNNNSNVSAYCANSKSTINIRDVYNVDGFNFSGTMEYDKRIGYRSKSMLVYPLENHSGDILGVFQLINRRNKSGELTYFSEEDEVLLVSLAKQAALIIDSRILVDQHKKLLDSFVEILAQGVGEKSPHTYEHIKNVTKLGSMIAEAVSNCKQGMYGYIEFTQEQFDEIRLAGWMHDLGKITTPEYIVSKDVKLQALNDRFEIIAERFNSKIKDLEIDCLRQQLEVLRNQGGAEVIEKLTRKKNKETLYLRTLLVGLKDCNTGEERMSEEKKQLIHSAAKLTYKMQFKKKYKTGAGGASKVVDSCVFQKKPIYLTLLNEDEKESLLIQRGTISQVERQEIMKHAERSWRWLSSLPFPEKMRNLPLFAGAHHELLNGTGYPNKLKASQLPIQARILVIADIFEAISSATRPYRSINTLSEVMNLMGAMIMKGELDAEIMRIFVTSKCYAVYAKKSLLPRQIDDFKADAWLRKYIPADFKNTLPEYPK